MSKTEQLQKAFQELLRIPEMTFAAKVLSVNKQAKTIEAEDEELKYDDIRLTASIDDKSDKVILYPKVGSWVLVGLIGNDENTLSVCSVSEVESIEGVIGKSFFQIDKDGYRIVRDGKNIRDVLVSGFRNQNKINDELQKVVVSIGVTPNIPALEAIKTNNEQVINDIQTVFKA